MESADRLMEMKQAIDKSRGKLSELKGRKEALEEELKNKWGLADHKTAGKALTKMEQEVETLSGELNKGIRELEEKYNG